MRGEEMTRIKLKRKQTLKKRIQRSLSMSSFMTVVISIVSILLLISVMVQPLGSIFTESINNKIYRKYISTVKNMTPELMGEEKEMSSLKELSYQELKSLDIGNNSRDSVFSSIRSGESIPEIHTEFNIELQDMKSTEAVIIAENMTDDCKKNLLLASITTLEEIDGFISMGRTMGINWANIEFNYNDVDEFRLPQIEPSSTPSEGRFSNISSVIKVIDMKGNQIGALTTTLNPDIILIFSFPLILMFVVIGMVTLLIVKILILPISYKILQPITALNIQLQKISSDEMLEVKNIKLEQKNPPKEILELINYSNAIMSKLQGAYNMLENHKEELEAQNHELDVQNYDLMESQTQLKSAQDRLVQSEKMASMGQLTAAIAHEINTPMGAITSNSQMIDMMLMKLEMTIPTGDEEKIKKIIDSIKKSSNISSDAALRINEIIKNLRNFSRIDQAKFQAADVNEGIRSVLVLTSNLWKNKLTINENYGNLPDINCYPSMLNQVFMNIIVNAIHATEKGGVIDINTDFDDSNVYINITDNGTGINDGLLEAIFESGFTTKKRDQGTGLGLSISKDIIQKHHGSIVASNNDGPGATFTVTLPIEQKDDSKCEYQVLS